MMFTTVFTIVTLILAVTAAELSVNTPKSVTTCKPVTLTWKGGKPPYTVSVVPGDDPCDQALVVLPSTNDTWFHWQNPNLKPGTNVIFAVEDAAGDEDWSNEITFQQGDTTSCDSTPSTTGAGPATTLVVPVEATSTVPASSGPGNTPVANPGSNISAATPSSKGGFVAVGVGLLVAFTSVVFAL